MPRYFLILFVALTLSAVAQKPNVILIMADDLAYGDLSCYGSTLHKTPVLDKMAREGVRLTSFYSGNTVCTPSRMALLTGAYPRRLGWRGGVVGYGVKTVNGLAPQALTIAEVFKSRGYETGMSGKWHLGDEDELLPMNQGFDTAYYIRKSNNQTKKLFRDSELLEDPFTNKLLSEQFTKEAIAFIEKHKAKPFFLYVPHTAPHFPAEAHPDWEGKSQNKAYGDVVEELDARVGELLAALKKNGLDEKTLVVFISDNGTEPGQRKMSSPAPFRGMKWSAMEGGNRVPCIARWPGQIPPGQVRDELVGAIDLLPTLTAACGINLSAISKGSPKIDGVDVWNVFTSTDGGPHPRKELLFFHGWGQLQAIRSANWKLYVDKVKEISGSNQGPVLINLAEDMTESTNVAAAYPEKVKELLALAKEQIIDIETNTIPLGGRPITKPFDAKKKRGAWLQ
jgi:arylsulfatase A-like enzyme